MRSIHFLIQTRAIFMHHSTADEHNGQVAIEGKTHRRYRRLGSDYRYLVFLCTIQLMYKASSRISAPVLPTFLFGSLRSQTVYLNLVARLILVRAWRKAEIRFHRVSACIKGGGDSPFPHDDGNFCTCVFSARSFLQRLANALPEFARTTKRKRTPRQQLAAGLHRRARRGAPKLKAHARGSGIFR